MRLAFGASLQSRERLFPKDFHLDGGCELLDVGHGERAASAGGVGERLDVVAHGSLELVGPELVALLDLDGHGRTVLAGDARCVVGEVLLDGLTHGVRHDLDLLDDLVKRDDTHICFYLPVGCVFVPIIAL